MKQPFVVKYRPSRLDDYIFNDKDVENKVRQYVSEKTIPHILLSGSAGTGKSSLARVITNEIGIQDSDILRINASLDNGVGIIREQIYPWCKRAAFSPFKVVVLEEAEKLTFNAQKALLDVVEEFESTVKWILTCNYPQKLDPAIHSRMRMNISLKEHNKDDVINRAVEILAEEGIDVKDDSDFFSHINAYLPDIRKILNSMESHVTEDNVLLPLKESQGGKDLGAWTAMWEGKDAIDFDAAMELTELIDQNNFESFYEVMYNNSKKFPKEAVGVVAVSKYLDRALRAANQRLHMKACLFELFVIGEDND